MSAACPHNAWNRSRDRRYGDRVRQDLSDPLTAEPLTRPVSGAPPLGRGYVQVIVDASEVSEFLTSRRAKITPEMAGPVSYDGSRRRVPGLRREEAATLAGVSADYYKRLERGNLAGVSDSVREAIARPATRRRRTRPSLRPRPVGESNTTDPRHEVRERFKLGPLVVDDAAGDVDLDGLLDLAHLVLLPSRTVSLLGYPRGALKQSD